MLDLKPFFVFGAMFDEFPESKSFSLPLSILPKCIMPESQINMLSSSQVFVTLTAAEVPPAENPGFLGIDNGMDHNYYLQLAGRYAVLYHEI